MSMQAEELEPEWFLTVPAAARLVGISASKMYRIVAAGRIQTVRLDTARRIPRDELERFVSELREPIGT